LLFKFESEPYTCFQLNKLFAVSSINEIVESAPGRGGGGGRGGGSGKSNSSTGGKRSGYILHGGLYPVSRTAKEAPVKTPVYKGIGAWGIIGIVLAVLVIMSLDYYYSLTTKLTKFIFTKQGLCVGMYYALYLCDLYQRTDNYSSNLAAQTPHLMTEKPRPEENGNGNIPMTDKNELAKTSSMKTGLNSEVFL
jgi:hypothetical protein